MKIKDYIKLYSKCTLHQDLSLLYTGDEYFIPIDLQKETYFHVVVGNADESIGHNFIEVEDEILTNGTRFSGYLTSDFDKSGEIKCIKIGQN